MVSSIVVGNISSGISSISLSEVGIELKTEGSSSHGEGISATIAGSDLECDVNDEAGAGSLFWPAGGSVEEDDSLVCSVGDSAETGGSLTDSGSCSTVGAVAGGVSFTCCIRAISVSSMLERLMPLG